MNTITQTDVVVLGAGPGGYTAAFMAADLGFKVTLVDPEANPGGVCLHRGCIPTKSLLHISKIKQEAQKASQWGMTFESPKVDIDKVREWKDSVITRLTGGLGQLSKARKINYIRAYGTFDSSTTMTINAVDGAVSTLEFKYAIIATGSEPRRLPFLNYESDKILDAKKALELKSVPERLLVIGGGYIGLEIGYIYQALGSKSTIVEMTDSLMPGMDPELTKIFEDHNKTYYEAILKETKVAKVNELESHLEVTFEDKNGEQRVEAFDAIMVAIGQAPANHSFGVENTQVALADNGFVQVDHQQRTTDEHIFAIGDVVGGPLLAHKASYEARIAAEVIAGKKSANDAQVIPAVVYTDPEIATVGVSEPEAKAKGLNFKVAKFPWAASGRAVAMGDPTGLTKLIIEEGTERIIGAGIVGKNAGDLISEMALAVEMAATATDIEQTIHPHPTLSETIMETAGAFYGNATHVFQKMK